MWYTNDIELARFDEEDVTPFTIKTRPDLFNATVGLTSVIEVNGYYLFDNFTLTARVSDFLPLQGQNLTCGTLLDRSEPFRANTFSICKFVFSILEYELHTIKLTIYSVRLLSAN